MKQAFGWLVGTAALLTAAALLIVAAGGRARTSRLALDVATPSLDAADYWSPPLWESLRSPQTPLPTGLIAAAVAAALAALCYPIARSQPIAGLLILLSVANRGSPADVPLMLLTFALFKLASQTRIALHGAGLVIIAAVAATATVDFGYALVIVVLVSLVNRRWTALLLAGVFAAAVFFLDARFPGLFAALMRPASWYWCWTDPQRTPSIAPVWSVYSLSNVGLLGVGVWSWFRGRNGESRVLAAVPLFVLGVLCRYYLAAGVYALAMHNDKPLPRTRSRAVQGCLCVGVLGSVWLWSPELTSPTWWMSQPTRLQALSLGRPATVLPFDLSRAREPGVKLRPVMDERWDVYGDAYQTYDGVCRDLSRARFDSYVRTDGKLGGYRLLLSEWNVSLLDVPASREKSLRNLAINRDLKIVGVDERRVLFALKTASDWTPTAHRADQELRNLEWPTRETEAQSTGIVRFDTNASRRSIARTLVAFRLPYAALSVVAPVEDATIERAWSYIEIAHRHRRHSGASSILDQYRALSKFRRLLGEGRLSVDETIRLSQSAASIGLLETAVEIASSVDQFPRRLFFSHSVRNAVDVLAERLRNSRRAAATLDKVDRQKRLTSLLQLGLTDTARTECVEAYAAVSDETQRAMLAEQALRLSLLLGDAQQAEEWLERTPPSVQTLYAWLVDGTESPAALMRRLQDTLPRFEGSRSQEAWLCYNLACLYLEMRQVRSAVGQFQRSWQLDPDAEYRHIRTIHLTQLQR